jgi:hypothetical protein
MNIRIVLLAVIGLTAGVRSAIADSLLATPPIVGAEDEHVVCLVSNVGTQPAPIVVTMAGPLAMEVLLRADAEPLPAGSFNAYPSTQFTGYCKVEGSKRILRDLRVAACVAPPGDRTASCRVTVDAH